MDSSFTSLVRRKSSIRFNFSGLGSNSNIEARGPEGVLSPK